MTSRCDLCGGGRGPFNRLGVGERMLPRVLCVDCQDVTMRKLGVGEATAGRMSWEAVNAGYQSFREKVGLPPGEPLGGSV